MTRSTRLVFLIKNIYTLWGRKRSFCLLHTFRRTIPFYSTSNWYNKEERYSRVPRLSINKEERYSREPRLSVIRYSAKGTKRKWRYVSSKARLKYATYRR